jgi:replicative DNA helicase
VSGRVQPHNEDAERSVLGGILLRTDALTQIPDVQPEDFYVPAHQDIHRAMLALFEHGRPIDVVTLEEELQRQQKLGRVGGVAYLAELQASVPTAENIAHYGRIVRDHSTLRQLIARASEIAARAHEPEGEVGEFLDLAEHQIFEIAQRGESTSFKPIKPLMLHVMDAIARRNKQGVTGVPTGFAQLDDLTAGLQPAELIVLAARPSVGKTSFALSLALNAAVERGLPVLFFSLEMSFQNVVERMLCATARVDTSLVRSGFVDKVWGPLTRAASKISEAPMFLDDSPTPTVLEIRSKARRFRADKKVFPEEGRLGLVIVDYLQLVKPHRDADTREQEVSAVSRGLKALAKDLHCPVVALAQLRRSAEDRQDQVPRLSDLRESGAIEQDADVVAFLHRDKQDPSEDAQTLKLVLAKQRNGPTGDVDLVFLRKYTRFESAATHA